MIRDSKQTVPDKPRYLWFCPGANHAPHRAPAEYIAEYKGVVDDGYEAYREWVLPQMIERGILSEGTELTPVNPMAEGTFTPTDLVRPWDELNDQERALFSRMAEVYAGFSEYTDAPGRRIVDHLEESGQLDNTITFYCADNGASGEGSPNGGVNEGKVFGGYPDDLQQNLAMIDQLGSPDTYNHDPTGGRRRSRPRTGCSSATRTRAACATRWSSTGPPGSPPRVRSATSTTTRPTSSRRSSTSAASRCPTRTTAWPSGRWRACRCAPRSTPPTRPRRSRRSTTRMFGSRGIWHDGWKAVTEHGPTSGMSNFDNDRWQLLHTDEDRSEAHASRRSIRTGSRS